MQEAEGDLAPCWSLCTARHAIGVFLLRGMLWGLWDRRQRVLGDVAGIPRACWEPTGLVPPSATPRGPSSFGHGSHEARLSGCGREERGTASEEFQGLCLRSGSISSPSRPMVLSPGPVLESAVEPLRAQAASKPHCIRLSGGGLCRHAENPWSVLLTGLGLAVGCSITPLRSAG